MRVFNLFWIFFSITTIELTIIWNHVLGVIGPNGKISYPAQLLPLLIGTLGFLRICWLLFQKWLNPEPDCCDENEVPPEKLNKSNGAPPATPGVGLGLLSSPSAGSERPAAGTGEDSDQSITRHRRLAIRYLVAYLPWLSQFQFWKNPKGDKNLQSSPEEGGRNYRDSPLTEMRTSYKSVEGDEGTSPMIDMKSPTSLNSSPMMNFKS
jgi:hypothetical protein